MGNFAEIVVSNKHKAVDKKFHYRIPEDLFGVLEPGMRVIVPFGLGNKKIEGYVIGFSDTADVSSDKLKTIISALDTRPVLSRTMLDLAEWMKDKYYATLSECLWCILPTGLDTKSICIKRVKLNKDVSKSELETILAKGDQKSKILEILLDNDGIEYNTLKTVFKITDSPIKTLVKNKIITIELLETYRDTLSGSDSQYMISGEKQPLTLNHEQKNALNVIENMLVSDNSKQPVLLHGVTGGGKTEVYLQTIDIVLKLGKQAIVLVPEISLTSQAVSRFFKRFGKLVSVTHSRMSSAERYDQWRKARDGVISIMIGPRSAIFTPFDRLGAIIVDEEQENTYKSETTPKYDVCEVAEKIMQLTGAILIFGSATPSVETYYKVKTGRFNLLKLSHRANNSPMPLVHIIDMRAELADGNRSVFSRELYSAIDENLKNNSQTILFINRRGHSTFVSCRSCGYVLACDQCSINYTYHIAIDKLLCHYCGKEEKKPLICPVCGSEYIRHFGVGTQKVEEEIKRLFPEARVLRMDMDTTSKKHSHENIISSFAQHRADILIGTQMIAKGHDFPGVTLVGVIAADLSLNTGDFRSSETTYQLITQVSGRAGRAMMQGTAYIQTYTPEHYSIIFAKDNDYTEFYDHEIILRKSMEYPPFTNIFEVLFSGEDEKKIIVNMNKLNYIMTYYNNKKGGFEILGPSPAQISKINNNYRWRLLVKCIDEEKIKSFVFHCLKKLRDVDDLSGMTVSVSLNPRVLN